MRIALLGAPGSGKETQGERIVARYGPARIVIGDLLRSELARDTEPARLIREAMDAGGRVSDELMLMTLDHRLDDWQSRGFMLDGFPTTLRQAEALSERLDRRGQPLDVVLFLDVDYREILRRLLSGQNEPDAKALLKRRLQEYENQTAPLIDYYKARGNLRWVRGDDTVDAVAAQIDAILDNLL